MDRTHIIALARYTSQERFRHDDMRRRAVGLRYWLLVPLSYWIIFLDLAYRGILEFVRSRPH